MAVRWTFSFMRKRSPLSKVIQVNQLIERMTIEPRCPCSGRLLHGRVQAQAPGTDENRCCHFQPLSRAVFSRVAIFVFLDISLFWAEFSQNKCFLFILLKFLLFITLYLVSKGMSLSGISGN